MNSPLRLLSLVLMVGATLWAGPRREEALNLFENRKVVVAVPDGFTVKSGSDELGVTAMQLATANDKVTASLIFAPDPEHETATTRGRAEKMVEQFKDFVDGSVEKAMQFEELEPKTGAGTFCVFTDAKLVDQKDLPPNEYLHVTTGLKSWPGVMVIFRVFSNDTTSPQYQAVMKMLRESVQERIVPLK